jgi:hypothetical protein
LVHHTASAFAVARPGTGIYDLLVRGRSDLPGPLCNWAGNSDGSVTYIAAHPANHAGASGGRSMGPLPVTSLFNRRVMGLEIVYPGTEPMRDAQYRTALIWSRIVTDVCGFGNIQRARAHAETSITGKFDPGDAPGRTINMAAFRTAAVITAPAPQPAPLPEEDDMVKFMKGDSNTPIPGTDNTYGDVVFKVEYVGDFGAIAVRTRVPNPDEPGFRAFLAAGGKVVQVPQAVLDRIPDKATAD